MIGTLEVIVLIYMEESVLPTGADNNPLVVELRRSSIMVEWRLLILYMQYHISRCVLVRPATKSNGDSTFCCGLLVALSF